MAHDDSHARASKASFWFVPLPAERVAVARRAAILGLISAGLLFLAAAAGSFALCLNRTMGVGGVATFAIISGFLFAMLVHFFACRGGRRISLLGFVAATALSTLVLAGADLGAKYVHDRDLAVDQAGKSTPNRGEAQQREVAAERAKALAESEANSALTQELTAKVLAFYDAFAGDDESKREAALSGFLYTDADLERLFADSAPLRLGLQFARNGMNAKSQPPTAEMQRIQRKNYLDVIVTDQRTKPDPRFAKIVSAVPKDIPFYSVVFDFPDGKLDHGACFRIDDRWVWVPFLDQLSAKGIR